MLRYLLMEGPTEKLVVNNRSALPLFAAIPEDDGLIGCLIVEDIRGSLHNGHYFIFLIIFVRRLEERGARDVFGAFDELRQAPQHTHIIIIYHECLNPTITCARSRSLSPSSCSGLPLPARVRFLSPCILRRAGWSQRRCSSWHRLYRS